MKQKQIDEIINRIKEIPFTRLSEEDENIHVTYRGKTSDYLLIDKRWGEVIEKGKVSILYKVKEIVESVLEEKEIDKHQLPKSNVDDKKSYIEIEGIKYEESFICNAIKEKLCREKPAYEIMIGSHLRIVSSLQLAEMFRMAYSLYCMGDILYDAYFSRAAKLHLMDLKGWVEEALEKGENPYLEIYNFITEGGDLKNEPVKFIEFIKRFDFQFGFRKISG